MQLVHIHIYNTSCIIYNTACFPNIASKWSTTAFHFIFISRHAILNINIPHRTLDVHQRMSYDQWQRAYALSANFLNQRGSVLRRLFPHRHCQVLLQNVAKQEVQGGKSCSAAAGEEERERKNAVEEREAKAEAACTHGHHSLPWEQGKWQEFRGN